MLLTDKKVNYSLNIKGEELCILDVYNLKSPLKFPQFLYLEAEIKATNFL